MAKLSEIAAWVGAEWHAPSKAEAPGQKAAGQKTADGKRDPQADSRVDAQTGREVDPDITCVSGIALAGPQSVVFAESAASAQAALASAAGAVLLGLDSPVVNGSVSENPGSGTQQKPVLRVRQPRLAFAVVAKRLKAAVPCRGIHPTAVIAAGARLASGVAVGAYAVVGEEVELETGVSVGEGCVLGDGVKVGAGTKLYPRVTVYAGTTIGERVVVHAGAVLGADGFGYARDAETGEYTQFPQQGTLVIEDDVEIGANTTIDRGALEETRIGRGSKLDNLVHIGHNCRIGRNVVIAAQTGISGSSVVEDGAVLGGQVGIGEHALVGPGVILGGGAGVLSGKKLRGPGQVFWGRPALPLKEYLRGLAEVARLHEKGRK